MAKRRPSRKTIQSVFNWLHSNGLSVYGPATDLERKQGHFGCQDYNADTAIKYAKIKDKLKEPQYPGEEDGR